MQVSEIPAEDEDQIPSFWRKKMTKDDFQFT
jgi:hypothetical protein